MSIWAEVNSFTLAQNVKILRRMVGESFFWANVANNAYGHDLSISAEAFWRGGVDGYVVTNASDATWLRKHFKLPILILFPLEDHELPLAAAQDWHIALTSGSYFERVAHYARTHRKLFHVHYELDTGNSGTGLDSESLAHVIRHQADNHPLLVPCGLFTRINDASHDEQTRVQLVGLQEFQFNLQREGIIIPPTHVLTSETLIRWGDSYIFDGVRLGEALYGINGNYVETMPALSLKTKIIATYSVKSGQHVGYRPRTVVNRLTKIAVIQFGYLNGLDRRVRDKGCVLIWGRRCSFIGGIGPYLSLVDITGLGKIEEGETVTILGTDGTNAISPNDMADWIGKPAVEWINSLTQSVTYNKLK